CRGSPRRPPPSAIDRIDAPAADTLTSPPRPQSPLFPHEAPAGRGVSSRSSAPVRADDGAPRRRRPRVAVVRGAWCGPWPASAVRVVIFGVAREWRNGRRAGFRCQCPYGRGGSSPPSRTRSDGPLPSRTGAVRVLVPKVEATAELVRNRRGRG